MATKKISELDALSEADDNDVLVIVDVSSQTTYKISKQNFLSDIKAQIEELEENQLKNLLLGKESGQELILNECSDKTIKGIKTKGTNVQSEIPTPNAPAKLKSAGDIKNIYYLPEAETSNGIEYTINLDGTINLVGEATADTTFLIEKNLDDSYIKSPETYTLSANQELPTGLEIKLEAYMGRTRQRDVLGGELNNSVQAYTGTANVSDSSKINYTIFIANGSILNVHNLGLQLEEGSIATDFSIAGIGFITETISNENGTETQEFSIPCQQPMRSIGEIRDEFIKVNGVWYERHNIGKTVFRGRNEAWAYSSWDSIFEGATKSKFTNLKLPTDKNEMPNIKCTHFITTDNNHIDDALVDNAITLQTPYSITPERNPKIRMTSITSTQDFKAWLQNNNLELLYVMTEPIDLICTQQQIAALEQIETATTYKGITIISSQDLVPAYIEISYIKDLQLVADDLTS